MNKKVISTVEYYNRLARSYDPIALGGRISKPDMVYEAMRQLLGDIDAVSTPRSGDRPKLLDLASGSGLSALPFHRRGWDVTCVEDSPEMIRKCAEKKFAAAIVPLDLAMADRLPFPDSSFDAVTCNAGLHYLPNSLELLAEMTRVAKNLIGITYQPGDVDHVRKEGFRDAGGQERFIETFFDDPQQVRTAFNKTGAKLAVSRENVIAYKKESGEPVVFNIEIYRKEGP